MPTREFRILGALTLLAALGTVLGVTPAAAEDAPRIGLGSLRILDVKGQSHALGADSRRPGSVFVFLSSECPISRQYVPELNRLASVAEAGRIPFYGVLSDPTLTRQAAVKFVDEFRIAFPVLFDASGELAERFGPQHVPEAFLVDAVDTLRYRGRIDDLYAEVGKRRAEPTSRDLRDAMTALIEKRPIATAKTDAVGCPFQSRRLPGKGPAVTYARDIAPILFAHCVECHRPGEVAPFSLLNYQDAAKRAVGIEHVTGSRTMPPWKAAEGFGHFLDERRLSAKEIALLKNWAEAGAPEGDAADLPPAPKFSSGWRLGEPDAVVEVSVPFEVPADGPDIFQHFVLPTQVAKDEMLVGFEFRPGNPSVVHHAIVFMDTSGRARARDEQTPEPGWRTSGSIDVGITSMVGVWTPGMTPRFYPDDVGIPFDKGADVVIQLHIHPSGKPQTDRSKVALYFAKKPVKKIMSRNPLLLGSLIIEIPPGEKHYRAGSKFTLPFDVTFSSVLPHMHLIGKEMKVTATLPDGVEKPLIWIKDWSFYWQDSYTYDEPLKLPKGTTLAVEAWYDNSADNPFNPQKPPKTVMFGNDTTDEMCFTLFQVVIDDPAGMRRGMPGFMQTMMAEWNAAPLSPEARVHIMNEAAKLFGGGARRAMQPTPAPEKPAEKGP